MSVAFALALALSAPPDDYNLAWKLKEGDTFYLQGKVTIEQSFNTMGRAVEQELVTETVTRFRVEAIKDGATVVEMTYLSNKTTAKGLPGADALNGKLRGVAVTATLDGKMEVVKVEGYDKILDALAGDNEQLRAAVKTTLPEGAVKLMFNDTFSLAPGGVTKLGGTWKRNASLPMPGLGEVSTATTFKLDAVKDETASVTWTATGKFEAGAGALPGLPVKLSKADLKIEKLNGGYSFDLAAGRIRSSKTGMEMSGTMTFAANGKEAEVEMKQKLTQTATISDRSPIKE